MSTSNDQNVSSIEQEIPAERIRELREAGASHFFIEVIQTTADAAGVPRNSAREEVLKYIEWAEDSPTKKSIAEYVHYGGGFFQELFNADGMTIPYSADQNNKRLLLFVIENR